MEKEKFIKALGEQIGQIRNDKKLSLYKLAQKTGKQPGALQRLEKGKITPSIYYLSEIANGLGVELEELVKGLP